MTRLRVMAVGLLVVSLAAATAAATYAARSDDDSDGNRRIALRDDCDKRDTDWNMAPGGCTKRGNVSFAEFNDEVASPRSSTTVVGHPSWRNDPSYLVVKPGAKVRVKNTGGRPHTFTRVAEFGGGVVPELSTGLTLSPECLPPVAVLPGDSTTVSGLTVGTNRFLCCFHPWMRALVEVKPGSGNDDDDDD